jgi:predicted DNA-binding protein
MNTMSLDLPEVLYQRLGELAKDNGTSANLFVAGLLAEKVFELRTEEYLAKRIEKRFA